MTLNASTAPTQANFYQARLLVVEDNPDHYALIRSASQQVMPEVEVIWAMDAEKAYACLEDCLLNQTILPKLLLLDLYLPDADQSWNLLRAIKQRESPYQRIPVVVFSYSDRRDDINDFYMFGGTSYIIKPINYEQWLIYFQTIREYWWETVTLPGNR
jgi:CheY-like chemotaxis protein